MKFWIVLVALIFIALGFTLLISRVNLGLQEIGSVSITLGAIVCYAVAMLPPSKEIA